MKTVFLSEKATQHTKTPPLTKSFYFFLNPALCPLVYFIYPQTLRCNLAPNREGDFAWLFD